MYALYIPGGTQSPIDFVVSGALLDIQSVLGANPTHAAIAVTEGVGSATHYVLSGAIATRPTLPDIEAATTVNTVLTLTGFPVASGWTCSGAMGGPWAFDGSGEAQIRFQEAGTWTISVTPPFPYIPRSYQVVVT